MNIQQIDAAKAAMVQWLCNSNALGKAPAQIQCVGELELDELHYYLFKYKKSLVGRWLLGICGGYTADSLQHCGHIISLMEPYRPHCAQEDALRMLRWFRRDTPELDCMDKASAPNSPEPEQDLTTFLSFVLLDHTSWDRQTLLQDLKENWGIQDTRASLPPPFPAAASDSLALDLNGAILTLSLMPCCIPGGQAQQSAARNFTWKNGSEHIARHKAHVIVAVLNRSLARMQAATFLIKAVCSVCRQQGSIAVCTNSVAYPVPDYLRFAQGLHGGELPFYDLVWVGLGRRNGGICGYTRGLAQLGYDELEILDSSASPKAVHEFLSHTALRILQDGLILQSGKSVGLTEEQQFEISLSEGVCVPGMSLKIDFCV